MNNIALTTNKIQSMSSQEIDKVMQLEGHVAQLPQIELETSHILHNGVYSRTMFFPAGTLVIGALIKVSTILIIQGSCAVYIDGGSKRLDGYNVFAAEANRKQALLAITDVYATMLFSTYANTIEEAEEQFTDETHKLMSRRIKDIDKFMLEAA